MDDLCEIFVFIRLRRFRWCSMMGILEIFWVGEAIVRVIGYLKYEFFGRFMKLVRVINLVIKEDVSVRGWDNVLEIL